MEGSALERDRHRAGVVGADVVLQVQRALDLALVAQRDHGEAGPLDPRAQLDLVAVGARGPAIVAADGELRAADTSDARCQTSEYDAVAGGDRGTERAVASHGGHHALARDLVEGDRRRAIHLRKDVDVHAVDESVLRTIVVHDEREEGVTRSPDQRRRAHASRTELRAIHVDDQARVPGAHANVESLRGAEA